MDYEHQLREWTVEFEFNGVLEAVMEENEIYGDAYKFIKVFGKITGKSYVIYN